MIPCRRVPLNRRTLYLDDETLSEMRAEAVRQGRGLSWIATQAVKAVMPEIQAEPSPVRNSPYGAT